MNRNSKKRIVESAGVPWSFYDNSEFSRIDDLYLPSRGEGETMASQVVTAVNKLVYKWYNDGDVFDNTYCLEGWANDLSSYANWLYKHIDDSRVILDRISKISTRDEYSILLKDLTVTLLDGEFLDAISNDKKIDSIYECDGPFEFVEQDAEEDDDYEDEYYEDEYDEDEYYEDEYYEDEYDEDEYYEDEYYEDEYYEDEYYEDEE